MESIVEKGRCHVFGRQDQDGEVMVAGILEAIEIYES